MRCCFQCLLIVLCSPAGLIGQSTFFSSINHSAYGTSVITTRDSAVVTAYFDLTTVEIVKTDTNGQVIWENSLPFQWMSVVDMDEAADGGILVLMKGPNSNSSTLDCAYVLRLKPDGYFNWFYGYYANSNDYFLDIQALGDTGFICLGNGCSSPGAQVVRFNKQGSILWHHNYTLNTGSDYLGWIRFTLMNNGSHLLIAGRTAVPAVNGDVLVADIDTAGTLYWMKQYSIPGTFEYPSRIVQTPTGFAVSIVFEYPSASAMYVRTGLAHFDTSGNMQWLTEYYPPTSSSPRSLAVLPDGSLLTGGVMQCPLDTTKLRAFIFHTDAFGQQLWWHAFSDSAYSDVAMEYVEGISVSGNSATLSGGGYKCYLAKINDQGYGMRNPVYYPVQTVHRNIPPQVARTCFISTPGFWTQFTDPTITSQSIQLQGYISCSNIITAWNPATTAISGWQVQNNAEDRTWIITGPGESVNATFIVYNSLGQEIQKSEITHGHSVLPQSDMAVGLYSYMIVSGGEIQRTGKMIIR